MGKKLYLDCSSGISGDMFVAAMLDLGADGDALERALQSIPDEGFYTEVRRVKKSGIDCCDFNVILDEEHENHDHDMEYLYGSLPVNEEAAEEDEHDHEGGHRHHHEGDHHCHCHEEGMEDHDHEGEHHCHCHEEGAEEHDHDDGHHHDEENHCHCHEGEHDHDDGHPHDHEEEHDHDGEHHHHDGHHHVHRGLAEINEIIAGCDMTESARDIAYAIFQIIGDAEAKAHDLPVEEVHFHEVGALDSIVDIISAAVCFDSLGIEDVIIPKLCEGTGQIRCQHGIMPVPVPATINIVSAYSLPMEITSSEGEYVTPTGAAIAAALCTGHELPSSFTVKAVGMGAGKREYKDRSGILRAMIIQGEAAAEKDEIVKLETDIDDCSGEVLGYTMKRLFKAGAKDVHYTPVFMKKNRPAWELTVLCDKKDAKKLERLIFEETTTIGIREFPVMRTLLKREEKTVETPYGKASVKEVTLGNSVKRYPEYETVKKLAKKRKVPFSEVFDAVKTAMEE